MSDEAELRASWRSKGECSKSDHLIPCFFLLLTLFTREAGLRGSRSNSLSGRRARVRGGDRFVVSRQAWAIRSTKKITGLARRCVACENRYRSSGETRADEKSQACRRTVGACVLRAKTGSASSAMRAEITGFARSRGRRSFGSNNTWKGKGSSHAYTMPT